MLADAMLSGLLICGCCGGAYSKISKNLFGCASARNKGICGNRLNIRVEAVESAVLDGLKSRLMDPALFRLFCDEFVRETNRLIQGQQSAYHAAEAELLQLKARRKRMVEAIAEGMPARSLREEMVALEAREDELNAMLAAKPDAKPFLHPNAAAICHAKVAELEAALKGEDVRDEAFDIIRSLIEEVRLVPEAGELRVELHGDLAMILALGAEAEALPAKRVVNCGLDTQNPQSRFVPGGLLSVVAGTHSHLYRTHVGYRELGHIH